MAVPIDVVWLHHIGSVSAIVTLQACLHGAFKASSSISYAAHKSYMRTNWPYRQRVCEVICCKIEANAAFFLQMYGINMLFKV